VSFSWDKDGGLIERAGEFPSVPGEAFVFVGVDKPKKIRANVLDTTWLYNCRNKTWNISVINEPSFPVTGSGKN